MHLWFYRHRHLWQVLGMSLCKMHWSPHASQAFDRLALCKKQRSFDRFAFHRWWFIQTVRYCSSQRGVNERATHRTKTNGGTRGLAESKHELWFVVSKHINKDDLSEAYGLLVPLEKVLSSICIPKSFQLSSPGPSAHVQGETCQRMSRHFIKNGRTTTRSEIMRKWSWGRSHLARRSHWVNSGLKLSLRDQPMRSKECIWPCIEKVKALYIIDTMTGLHLKPDGCYNILVQCWSWWWSCISCESFWCLLWQWR